MAPIDTAIGFIAGEGSFCITQKWPDDGKPYLAFQFDMELHAKDVGMLLEIREEFGGIGNLRENGDKAVWTVSSKNDLKRLRDDIAEWGDGIWKASEKCKNFTVWSRALDIHLDGRTTGEQQVRIAELARDLNADFGDGWDEFIEERQS